MAHSTAKKSRIAVLDDRVAAAAAAAAPTAAATQGPSPTLYRGCTQHARSGKWEAHIWSPTTGKQLYLGSWQIPELAALAYDAAALRQRGPSDTALPPPALNYHPQHYEGILPQLMRHSVEQVVAALRKLSKGGAARQSSAFRGVTRHAKGRWEVRIGAAQGRRYEYMGLHDSEVAGAMAYDRATLAKSALCVVGAQTNFHLSEYAELLTAAQLASALAQGAVTPEDLARRGLQVGPDNGLARPMAKQQLQQQQQQPSGVISGASADVGEGWPPLADASWPWACMVAPPVVASPADGAAAAGWDAAAAPLSIAQPPLLVDSLVAGGGGAASECDAASETPQGSPGCSLPHPPGTPLVSAAEAAAAPWHASSGLTPMQQHAGAGCL